ncbi:MAG: hypothetical protein ABJL67_16405 [Sulfitobacter sp.]
MRALHLSDLRAAVRALLHVPCSERKSVCDDMIGEADIADRFTRKLRKRHPRWGSGTLGDAAHTRGMAAEDNIDDVEYLTCLRIVVTALLDRRRQGEL